VNKNIGNWQISNNNCIEQTCFRYINKLNREIGNYVNINIPYWLLIVLCNAKLTEFGDPKYF
jgi:hypothetical protein